MLGQVAARDADAGEVQTIVAARQLRDANGRASSASAGRAPRRSSRAMVHNPDLVLVYESGTIGAKPHRIPLSIGDGELAETADAVVSVPEMFNYWIQPGRVEVAFLGAAQVDRFAQPQLHRDRRLRASRRSRLPGAGGAPEIAAACGEVVVIAPHSPRTFVERLDFVTSVGFGDGPGARERLGFRGQGPTTMITDLGVLEPDPETKELTLTQLHPGVDADQVREETGWPLAVAAEPRRTEPPTDEELGALRELTSR